MEISKTRLVKARNAAKKHLAGLQGAIQQVGRDLIAARQDAWADNEELKKEIREELDDQHELIEELFERYRDLNRTLITQIVFNFVLAVEFFIIAVLMAMGV